MAGRKTRNPYNPQVPPRPLPVFGTVPIISHSFPIVFRLSRPRTWVFPSISLLLGYTLTGWGPLTPIAIAVAVACLTTAATNIVNAYADRREDIVNQPSRVFFLERIGTGGALSSAALFYTVAAAVGLYVGPVFLAILFLGIFNSLFYSLRPFRFKARPFPSLISFSGAVGIAFLAGLSIKGTPITLLNPLLWLVTYFMLTYGTVKNLPDYYGDKRAGTRTSATIFRNINHAILFSGILQSTPYLLLTTLVLAGLLSPIYMLDLGFAAILALIFAGMWKAKTVKNLEKAHTLGFFYAISFLLFTLVLTAPTIESIVTVLAVYIWTLLVSKVNIDSRVEERDWENSRSRKH